MWEDFLFTKRFMQSTLGLERQLLRGLEVNYTFIPFYYVIGLNKVKWYDTNEITTNQLSKEDNVNSYSLLYGLQQRVKPLQYSKL